MTEAWFIDSLDARAGLAFASCRSADLAADEAQLDLPCVFVEPPTFRPQRVSSRTPAFAASRGSFQFGLYVGEAEVAFPALEDVIEFVRRAYLRGGGGDGAGGIGPGVPQIPGGAPEGEIFPEVDLGELGGGGVIGSMLHDAHLAFKAAHSLDFYPGKPFKTTEFKKTFQSDSSASINTEALAFGAVEIILELFRRFPVQGGDQELVRWFASTHRLGRAITKIGLWRHLFSKPWSKYLDDAESKLWQRMTVRVQAMLRPVVRSADEHHFFTFYLLSTPPSPLYWYHLGAWALMDTDPVDDLSAWPLAQSTAIFAGAISRYRSSVQDLVSAVLGSPGVLEADFPAARRAAALIIFAATHITSFGNPIVQVGLMSEELNNAAMAAGLRNGLDWLVEQFPARVFPAQIEKLIEGVSALTYA